MQLLLKGESVPSYPFVPHVIRAYARWEEDNFSQSEVRCVWALGMSSTTVSIVRDFSMVLWAYCFNGLRDSYVTTQLSSNISMNGQSVTDCLSVVKGKRASHVALINHRPATFLLRTICGNGGGPFAGRIRVSLLSQEKA